LGKEGESVLCLEMLLDGVAERGGKKKGEGDGLEEKKKRKGCRLDSSAGRKGGGGSLDPGEKEGGLLYLSLFLLREKRRNLGQEKGKGKRG